MPSFSSDNAGTWFYFDPANEALGGVCLRVLSGEEFRRIERMTVKKRRRVKRGVAFDDPQVDEKLASKMRWDYCITDWKQVEIDGQSAKCTAESKVKLMNKSPDFVGFINDSLEVLVETNKTLDEARVKNLPSSLSGDVE